MTGILKNIKKERHPEELIDLTYVRELKMKLQNRSQIFNFLTPVIYICGNPAVKLFAALIAVAVFFAFTTSVHAAIAVEAYDDGATAGSSITISSFTVSGSNRLMIVGVAINNNSNEYVIADGVTWNGTETFTKIRHDFFDNDSRTEIWYLKNPTATTANVVVTFNADLSEEAIAGVVTFTGANLGATEADTFRHDNGNSWDTQSPASISVNSAVNDVIFGVASVEYQNITGTTADAEQWRVNNYSSFSAAGGTKAGVATSTTISWTFDTADHCAISAVSFSMSTPS